ncbi:DNA-binding transcriptional regulator, LysR family [Lutimaribacter pacificus]|uniref:DNA-binding transcriptional regulator, LysR family n=1 Tax=Lutimaribacter pacificus TaxID=391948 RepID=A0A1H0D3N8_9RHOB|nr:LysR family transcriptional regulator [Lutimaribacter pacificus]SDN64780.1 DNA-binding transcriptional regulator, LysR family [Lutimaribacter pacificus]SHJ37267.1 DNA-binding transcriptional regulator, LysR family [Lutimaribacter pacificus]
MERNVLRNRTHPNLVDHLEAFVTVYEAGGFSAAARVLGRAVSSVSYAVAQLESHCGFELLSRGAGQVSLTERGRAVFAEARTVVDNARRFSAHARLLQSGEETRLRVLVDVLFPRQRLNEALLAFGARHPRARIQLFNVSLNTMWSDLRHGEYDLAMALTGAIPSDMEARAFGEERLAPYCAVTHPLAAVKGPVPAGAFQAERQFYYIGDPTIDVERVGRVFSTDIWTVDDVEQIRRLVMAGAGWCFGADFTFENELATGQVRRLDCADPKFHPVRNIGVVWPLERPPGILGTSFIELCCKP